jgi:uncharacterized protein
MSMWGSPMSGQSQPFDFAAGSGVRDKAVIHFFNAVYAWMAVGLAVTATVAWVVASNMALMRSVTSTGSIIGIAIAELVLVVAISGAINRISAGVATALFVLFAGLNGLLFSTLFIHYTLPSLGGTFIACAAMFGAMSLYGMFTKTNLTMMGRILFMALVGLIVASIVNIFVASSALYWLVSYAGVAIFAGLTAYDTQRLQAMAVQTQGNAALAARLSVSGALMLYLDFINLFIMLLRIMGKQRD